MQPDLVVNHADIGTKVSAHRCTSPLDTAPEGQPLGGAEVVGCHRR
jgi:hypothetical protein